MWFNLLKLDLSRLNLEEDLKPFDAEVSPIKVNNDGRCKQKLINFQNKLMGMNDRNPEVFLEKESPKNLPEHIACQCVEKLDEFFNSLTSFSFPVEKEVDDYYTLNDEYKLFIMYFSSNHPGSFTTSAFSRSRHYNSDKAPVTVLLVSVFKGEYYLRLLLPEKEHLLMQAVKKHWEES